MTVIATDGKTIASDSYLVEGGVIVNKDIRKLFNHTVWSNEGAGRVLLERHIIGLCGNYDQNLQYIKWITNKDADIPTEGMSAIHLTKEGVFGSDLPFFNLIKLADIYAIGSGCDIALGAMLQGASPEMAVKHACKHVITCGGKVVVMRVPE